MQRKLLRLGSLHYVLDDVEFLYPQQPPNLTNPEFLGKLRGWVASPVSLKARLLQAMAVVLSLGIVVLAFKLKDISVLITLVLPAIMILFVYLEGRWLKKPWSGYTDLLARSSDYTVVQGSIGEIRIHGTGTILAPTRIRWRLDTKRGLMEGWSPQLFGQLVAHREVGEKVYLAVSPDELRALFVGFIGMPPTQGEKAEATFKTFTGQGQTDRWDIQKLGLTKRDED